MREILFRAKRLYNGEWIEGLLWKKKCNSNKLFLSCFSNEDDDDEFFVVDPETVGQYTGLTDENGVKIFENGYMIIDNKTYKVTFNNAEYILINIFNRDIITLKNNSIKGVFVDEI